VLRVSRLTVIQKKDYQISKRGKSVITSMMCTSYDSAINAKPEI